MSADLSAQRGTACRRSCGRARLGRPIRRTMPWHTRFLRLCVRQSVPLSLRGLGGRRELGPACRVCTRTGTSTSKRTDTGTGTGLVSDLSFHRSVRSMRPRLHMHLHLRLRPELRLPLLLCAPTRRRARRRALPRRARLSRSAAA